MKKELNSYKTDNVGVYIQNSIIPDVKINFPNKNFEYKERLDEQIELDISTF